jgi:hypothetical protein
VGQTRDSVDFEEKIPEVPTVEMAYFAVTKAAAVSDSVPVGVSELGVAEVTVPAAVLAEEHLADSVVFVAGKVASYWVEATEIGVAVVLEEHTVFV